jgi:hypothetical protein
MVSPEMLPFLPPALQMTPGMHLGQTAPSHWSPPDARVHGGGADTPENAHVPVAYEPTPAPGAGPSPPSSPSRPSYSSPGAYASASSPMRSSLYSPHGVATSSPAPASPHKHI